MSTELLDESFRRTATVKNAFGVSKPFRYGSVLEWMRSFIYRPMQWSGEQVREEALAVLERCRRLELLRDRCNMAKLVRSEAAIRCSQYTYWWDVRIVDGRDCRSFLKSHTEPFTVGLATGAGLRNVVEPCSWREVLAAIKAGAEPV